MNDVYYQLTLKKDQVVCKGISFSVEEKNDWWLSDICVISCIHFNGWCLFVESKYRFTEWTMIILPKNEMIQMKCQVYEPFYHGLYTFISLKVIMFNHFLFIVWWKNSVDNGHPSITNSLFYAHHRNYPRHLKKTSSYRKVSVLEWPYNNECLRYISHTYY